MAKKIQPLFSRIQNFWRNTYSVLGISLWKMLSIYLDAIFKNPLGRQAASISWSFFLSLFPMILFFLSVCLLCPHYDKLQFLYLWSADAESISISYAERRDRLHQSSLIPNMKSISNFTILLSFIFATNGCFPLLTDLTGIQNFSELL